MLVSLLVSLVSAGSFGFLLLLDSTSTEVASAPSFGGDGLPAPAVDRDVGTAADEQVESPSLSGFLIWSGAIASGTVFLVSVVLFRVEVRKQKDVLRARRQREEYYRDLRKYNAQLKGPPRKNT